MDDRPSPPQSQSNCDPSLSPLTCLVLSQMSTASDGDGTGTYEKLCNLFAWIATQAGKPLTIIVVIIACTLAFLYVPQVDVVNFIVSIVSLVLSLMILGKQDRDEQRAQARDKAMHTKLDAIAHATEGVSEDVEGLEDKTEEEIDKVRREL